MKRRAVRKHRSLLQYRVGERNDHRLIGNLLLDQRHLGVAHLFHAEALLEHFALFRFDHAVTSSRKDLRRPSRNPRRGNIRCMPRAG